MVMGNQSADVVAVFPAAAPQQQQHQHHHHLKNKQKKAKAHMISKKLKKAASAPTSPQEDQHFVDHVTPGAPVDTPHHHEAKILNATRNVPPPLVPPVYQRSLLSVLLPFVTKSPLAWRLWMFLSSLLVAAVVLVTEYARHGGWTLLSGVLSMVSVAGLVGFEVCKAPIRRLVHRVQRRLKGGKHGTAATSTPHPTYSHNGVPVYVMMPLDLVHDAHSLRDPLGLEHKLCLLHAAGVDGIMVDVWWGLVESKPKQYVWDAYLNLFSICRRLGLKVQTVMSFHACGGNVGDNVHIPLPEFVREIGRKHPDIYYHDRNGHRDNECLSLGVDHVPLFHGRTAVQMYHDFMYNFAMTMSPYLGSVVTQIQVGLGPAGELRYPSYQMAHGRWHFPGIGEFQAYDAHMLQDLHKAANVAGHSEWAMPPQNAGYYNAWPHEAKFFEAYAEGNYESDYGRFFLEWYSNRLIQHGDDVLSSANSIFSGRCEIVAKIAGIHWWYATDHHAAEMTAGYWNTPRHDGYRDIIKMLKKNNASVDQTCLEMSDESHDPSYMCRPVSLCRQVFSNAVLEGVGVDAENALPCFDAASYERILKQCVQDGRKLDSFTYLRLCETLFRPEHWTDFVVFVRKMHSL